MMLVPHWLSARDQVKRVTSPQLLACFSVFELYAVFKTSSAHGPHLNVWILIYPQQNFRKQEKTRVSGLNSPLDINYI